MEPAKPMLKTLQAKGKSVGTQMREVMFGDLPWDVWCRREGPAEEPWPLFRAAWTAKKNGDLAGCIACLEQVACMIDIETRHRIQAWHFLRELGASPIPEEAKDVLGIIIETGLPEGTDVLGAYEDYTARYWGASGLGILWTRANSKLDDDFESFFAVAQGAVQKVQPRKGPRPPVPPLGTIQISLLTPSGVHMGMGSADILGDDPLAKDLVDRARGLVGKLTAQPEGKL
jgi:hypothetical protein